MDRKPLVKSDPKTSTRPGRRHDEAYPLADGWAMIARDPRTFRVTSAGRAHPQKTTMSSKSEPPELPHSPAPDAAPARAEDAAPSSTPPMVADPSLDAAAAPALEPSIDAADPPHIAPSPATTAPEPTEPSPATTAPEPAAPNPVSEQNAEPAAQHAALEWMASLQPVEPAPWAWPWVSIVIAVANVVVWGYTVAEGVGPFDPSALSLFEYGGNLGAITLAGEEWRLFTSLFMHSGVLHLAMNMVALVIGGRIVEQMYGRFGFAALYLISGLGASLATAMRPGVVSVGASGAIFGVLGAAGAYALVHRDRLDRRMLNAGIGLVAYVGYHLFAYFQYELVGGAAFGRIDMHAHLGGLGVGFACGLAMALVEGAPTAGALRPRMAIVAAIFLGALLVVAAVAPPPFDRDVEAARESEGLQAFYVEEERLFGRWKSLIDENLAGSLSDDQVVDALEREVVPPWRAARVALEAHPAAANHPLLIEYARAREEGWGLLIQGVRAKDQATLDRGRARLDEADAMVPRLHEAAKTRTSE